MRKFKRGAWKYYNRIMKRAKRKQLTYQEYIIKSGL